MKSCWIALMLVSATMAADKPNVVLLYACMLHGRRKHFGSGWQRMAGGSLLRLCPMCHVIKH